jgi:hypothetical protein
MPARSRTSLPNMPTRALRLLPPRQHITRSSDSQFRTYRLPLMCAPLRRHCLRPEHTRTAGQRDSFSLIGAETVPPLRRAHQR